MYYEKLQGVRERGEFEEWITFFLRGVVEVSREASSRTLLILDIINRNRENVLDRLGRNGPRGALLLDAMLRRPVLGVKEIKEITGLSYQNANKLASQLEDIGVLVRSQGRRGTGYSSSRSISMFLKGEFIHL